MNASKPLKHRHHPARGKSTAMTILFNNWGGGEEQFTPPPMYAHVFTPLDICDSFGSGVLLNLFLDVAHVFVLCSV